MAEVDMEAAGTRKAMIREKQRQAKLNAAAKSGDWNAFKDIFVTYPDATKERLNLWGETPLHVAVAARQDKFVKGLIDIMDPNDLEIRTVRIKRKSKWEDTCSASNKEDTSPKKNKEDTESGETASNKPKLEKELITSHTESGETAFSYAAMYGYEYGIRIMWKKNPNLVYMKDEHGRLPVSTAALNGHQFIVYLLYYNTPKQMEEADLFHLVVNSIKGGLYGFVQRVLTRHPFLATPTNDGTQSEKTILHALAQCPISAERSDSLQQYQGLLSLVWDQINVALAYEPEQTLIDMLGEVCFIAAEENNGELLSILTDSYSHVFMQVNENNHTAFHIAILNRCRNVFNVIHEFGLLKDFINEIVDVNGNNMLHLAGYLPSFPQSKIIKDDDGFRKSIGYLPLLNRLNDIPGAALQVQNELVWFEKVKKVMKPQQREAKNKDKLNPKDVFIKEHENLRKAGEEWMRNTANSCMVVAALIATVVFAAAFTVPGGNGQHEKDYGIPIFLSKPAFKVFAISDAISLVFSISTVLSFLSILTSRYSIDDFRISLPSKLILGLLFLFISIIAMMIAFVAAFFISFRHGKLGFAYPIAAIASIPIWLFVWQHVRLFYQVTRSTFFSSLLFKTKKQSIWTQMSSQIRNVFARYHLFKFF